MGCATEQNLQSYDQLICERWLAEMVDEIRGGNEEVKKELPFRAAHYSRFVNNHRTQKDADPEAFLFQTTVDVDKAELVEPCIKKALELNEDANSPWKGMLLHADYSARGKVHLDIRMPLGMTIGETQRAYCEVLGIKDEFDESCTTPERIIFITDRRQEIFRSEDWYVRLPEEELVQRRKAFTDRGLTIDGREDPSEKVWAKAPLSSTASTEGTDSTHSHSEAAEVASLTSLNAFDLCVQNVGLSGSELDIWGNHNWHTNLMAVLSVGLPKLMSKEQLRAVVRKRLPNYSQTKDCQNLIQYFYEKYTADKGFMTVSLRDINAKAQQMAQREATFDPEADDREMNEMTQDWNPPALPRKIPRIMNLLTRNYDARFHQMLLLSALPILSAHASHFRARYINGKVIGPQQFVAVIGGSGQGKGNCTDLFNEMCQYTLQANDELEWQKLHENTVLRDKKANAKERPEKYRPKLRLFETASKSSILELQKNVGKNGMLLGQFSEVDGLSSATRATFSDISVLLRKGWDGDTHRQFYMSDTTCNTVTHMNISLLMAGTVRAMLERMFSDANCEGGLMQRCIPVLLPKTRRTFRPPMQNFLSENEKSERDALIMELYKKDLALGDETQLLEAPMTCRSIGRWFDELEERYEDGLMTEAEADLSHRCGEFMLRAAIPLIALYGKESKEIVDFCRWVGETAFYGMCRIFGRRVQQDLSKASELLSNRLDARKTAEPLLDKLPKTFTVKQLQELRIKEGQSNAVRTLLFRYCKSGKLERVAKGIYRKCYIVSDTKKCNTDREENVTNLFNHTGNSNGDGYEDQH